MNIKHTKHLQKDNTGKGGGGESSNYEPGCFWIFCFLTVQKKQVKTSILFWTWDLSRNRNQLFFEKLLHANELKFKVSINVPDFL